MATMTINRVNDVVILIAQGETLSITIEYLRMEPQKALDEIEEFADLRKVDTAVVKGQAIDFDTWFCEMLTAWLDGINIPEYMVD